MPSHTTPLDRAANAVPPHLWFATSAVFHYLGPSFAVLLFPSVGVLGVAWMRIAEAVDLNGDGDTLDTFIMANASHTNTKRPGITSSLSYTWKNHSILGGFW